MKIVWRGLASLIMVLTLFSCDIEEAIESLTEADTEIDAMKEYITVNKHFQDACNTADASVLIGQDLIESSLKSTSGSVTIGILPFDLDSWPKVVTVDYGDGSTGGDGVYRSGKILIESDNWYGEVGSVHTTTFDNYYQDGYKIEGTRVATNLGNADGEGPKFNVVISDGQVSKDGLVITYTQNTTRTWTVGSDTPSNVGDDQYVIEGEQSGVSSGDISYQMSIREALTYVVLQRGFSEGILDVTMDGFDTIVLDYSASSIQIGDDLFPMN